MSNLLDSELTKKFRDDQRLLTDTLIPILIHSSVVRGGKQVGQNSTQLALALAIVEELWGGTVDPQKAWVVDVSAPISYKQWLNLYSTKATTEAVVAPSWLNQLRGWFSGDMPTPVTHEAINALLLYLTKSVSRPVVSLSSDLTALLLNQGKQVLHIVADSNLTKQYIQFSNYPQLKQVVFDQRVKADVLEAAALSQRQIDPTTIAVADIPVSSKLVARTKRKLPWRSGPMHLLVTVTGNIQDQKNGLVVVEQIVHGIADSHVPIKLLVYCGTDTKTAQKVTTVVQQARLAVAPVTDVQADCRVLYHQQLLTAHQQLSQLGWSWAHGAIVAPTVDLMTEAMASGSFVLALPTHNDWEGDLVQRSISSGVAKQVEVADILHQLHALMRAGGRGQSWIERAMHAAHRARAHHPNGAHQIAQLLSHVEAPDNE